MLPMVARVTQRTPFDDQPSWPTKVCCRLNAPWQVRWEQPVVLAPERMRGRWVLLLADLGWAVAMLGVLLAYAGYHQNRIALVIGNAAYQDVVELPKPAAGAAAVAQLLIGAGFSAVSLQENPWGR